VVIFAVTVSLVVFLWRTYVLPANMVGMAETNSVFITTAQPGLISDLFVHQFQEVTNGQPLCVVQPFSPELTQAALNNAAADLNIMRGRMNLSEIARVEAVASLRLDLLDQQTLLAIAQVRLNEAETNYVRTLELFNDNIRSRAELEIAQAQRDAYKSEVANRQQLVEAWERELATIGPLQTNATSNIDHIIEQAILRQQEELRALYQPIVLRAPIAGKVSAIFQFAGQHTGSRNPIMTISATRAERIIAFVRQPIAVHPNVGDYVTVRTRGSHRQQAPAQITQVGGQLEPISPFLMPWTATRRPVEMGLPVAIDLPPELNLVPGEMVELSLRK
jgi:multidrug resistance efflux pump